MEGEFEEIVARIKRVLKQRVRPGMKLENVTAQTPILGEGLGLDSVAALELVVGLEEEFDVALDESELTADTFKNLASLAAHMASKMSAARS